MTNLSLRTVVRLSLVLALASAFLPPSTTCLSSRQGLDVVRDIDRPPTFLDQQRPDDDDLNVLFMDDDDDDDESDEEDSPIKKEMGAGRQRWENLNPKVKQRLIEKGQQKAIENKKKREPAADKKRRKFQLRGWIFVVDRIMWLTLCFVGLLSTGMMMQFKKLQQEKKRASKIARPLGFDERAPLSAFLPGMEVTGVVISLTNFGAYIDVGTECDGLLHVSQITRESFIEHPRQVLSPGDEVIVTVRSVSTDLKKMHLTMLTMEQGGFVTENNSDDDDDRISLSEIQQDDELWGVLKRVTDYGAYVEVGAEVDGFLHFMDHPLWDEGSRPSQFMEAGQRVRVWVSDLDRQKRRIKLTGNRPTNLPGPRLEF